MTEPAGPASHDGDWPVVVLVPWTGPVDPDHPDANFLVDIATTSLADPMPTLERLAGALDVPVGALARSVLAKWTTAGSEAVLAVGPSAIARLRDLVDRLVEVEAGLDAAAVDANVAAQPDAGQEARRAAIADLVEQVQWLAHGVDDPAATYPGGGAGSGDVEAPGSGSAATP